MSKFVKLGFGLLSYSIFLVTFLYAIGFTGEVIVPKAINDGALVGVLEATVVNLALLTLFADQHSVMARPAFKRWWTRLIPEAVERSTFVLLASSALALLFWQWRPMPNLVWSTDSTVAVAVFQSLFWSGWALVLISTFLISHFELFGVRQVLADWTGRTLPSPVFKTPFSLPVRAASDLSGVSAGFLGHAVHVSGTPALCGRDHRIYSGRHTARRA